LISNWFGFAQIAFFTSTINPIFFYASYARCAEKWYSKSSTVLVPTLRQMIHREAKKASRKPLGRGTLESIASPQFSSVRLNRLTFSLVIWTI